MIEFGDAGDPNKGGDAKNGDTENPNKGGKKQRVDMRPPIHYSLGVKAIVITSTIMYT